MFTGLIEEVGTVGRLLKSGAAGARASIGTTLGPLVLGESVAVNGVCLTVDRIVGGGFEADLSAETLDSSTLGTLPGGARVNLERATQLGARMGGHIVQGHVDGVGKIVAVELSGQARRVAIAAPAELAPLVAHKGSIAIDGVSLTVNEVTDLADGFRFSVMLVPHTLANTTLLELPVGTAVNLEVDVLARYIERQLKVARKDAAVKDESSLLEKLRSGGYM